MKRSLIPLFCVIFALSGTVAGQASEKEKTSPSIRIGTFEVDATPPIGSPLAYDPMKEVGKPLSARGIVLLGKGKPIVLCAVDWIGIGNDGHTLWEEELARAAGTSPERVSLHALHQHDAPRYDVSAERLLREEGLGGEMFDPEFARGTIQRTAQAVHKAIRDANQVTHVGLGEAQVEKVASNRRILGDDGKVARMRWTSTSDPELRALPPGVIDPYVKVISFWQEEAPVAVLSYYACHPQSYYRTGAANPDFPGIARAMRQEEEGGLHVHFNGAGGNLGAGKWNDGSHENRQILANRLAAGMAEAWDATEKHPLTPDDLGWEVKPVALPPGRHLNEQDLLDKLQNEELDTSDRIAAAKALAWLRRCQAGEKIDIGCLRLGDARILHLPGELAVEYQLAAQAMAPRQFVAMAAYGDYAMGYISQAHHYWQGGYEASDRASRVAPSATPVLLDAMRELLSSDRK